MANGEQWMKKALALFLAVTLAASLLVGCGRVRESLDDEDEPETKASATAKPDNGSILDGLKKKEPTPSPEATPEATEAPSWPVPVSISTDDGMRTGFQQDGDWLVQPTWATAAPFTPDGLSVVSDASEKYGVIDMQGMTILPLEYDSVSISGNRIIGQHSLDEEPALAIVFDRSGREIFRLEAYLYPYKGGFAQVYGDSGSGFVDENGNWILQFTDGYVEDFRNGIARVYPAYGETPRYVDTTGRDVTDALSGETEIYREPAESEDTSAYRYGFKALDGSLITGAIYTSAEPFMNGTAIVGVGEDSYNNRYGLIDLQGNVVIEPGYCAIRRLSNGLFAVGEVLQPGAMPPYDYASYAMTALFDATGTPVSDWIYAAVEDFDDVRVMVSTERNVFYVGKDGEPDGSMPRFDGFGSMMMDQGWFVGTLDRRQILADEKGEIVARVEPVLLLDNGIQLINRYAANTRFDHLSHPELEGLADPALQERINGLIRSEMGIPEVEPFTEDGITYYEIYDGSWTAWQRGDLLIVEQDAYVYPLGAVHGQPYRGQLFINLTTGDAYQLDDLFRADALDEAYARMSAAVSEIMVETMEDYQYWETSTIVERNTAFRLRDDGFMLFYDPYVLASYAAGFTEFPISFAVMDDLIDKDGAFWKAMQGG